MADFTPNEGEQEMLNILLGKIVQPDLYVGLFQNSVANFESYGDSIVWSNIVPVTNIISGYERQLLTSIWVVPSSSDTGDAAVYSEIPFIASTGGADAVTGYYIRSSNNVLWVVGLHPDVELDSIPKAMPENAEIRISPQLGLE